MTSARFLTILLLGLLVPLGRAQTLPNPLLFVPEQAQFFVNVPNPQALLKAGQSSDLVTAIRALPPVREAYDSTTARRLYQLLAHFESKLNTPGIDLLDRVAGGGVVLASRLEEKAPTLLVMQGKDAALVQQFFDTTIEVVEGELAREGGTTKLTRQTYRKATTLSDGKELHAGLAGATLFLTNRADVLKMALDLQADGGARSLARSKKLAGFDTSLPPGPLARAWVSLADAHASQTGKELFASPRNDLNVTIAFGGLIDTIGRAPYVAAGVYTEGKGYMATVRLPAGHDGASSDYKLHVPPRGSVGTLPLLEPKGVQFSTSFYLDLASLWNDRTKLMSAQNVATFENTDKSGISFLAGSRISQLLTQTGPRHRFVVVNPRPSPYKIKPSQQLPSFAFIMELRQPEEFGRSVETILRGAALLAGQQVRLKLVEESYGDVRLIGYRFSEEAMVPQDPTNLRFNFSPCWVRVDRQLAFCSTVEFGREMIALLGRETVLPPRNDATIRARVYGAGVAETLRLAQDQLLAQNVLDQAIPVPEARKQVEALLDLVRRLGVVSLDTVHEPKRTRYDFRLTPIK